MPEHATLDNRRQIDLGSQAAAVLLVGQEVGWQGQSTPGQDHDEAVVAECTDEARERHWRDMIEHRTQLQAQAPMGRQQGIAGDLRAHLAVA